MDIPAVSKILILDGAERVFGPLSYPAEWEERREVCANLYEAVRILSALSEEELAVFVAPSKDLTKEHGSFLTFLKRHPFVRCIALQTDNSAFPAEFQQAIWEGVILPCSRNTPLTEAVRWAAESDRNNTPEKMQNLPEGVGIRISPEELEALFHSE
ncbi:MAG TPA: hypothetical protein PK054_12505 [Anaerohalosphaeraceae bacterium]|nr:hypothetical protein [Anaerohalosphaeraceae bacterium]HOL89121.1 hypothetical protein [Anaerohalosphaeraceae bacterium]HPP57387.1 hypothetical protein [Anaerohalosphaeraceae bacterium]